MNTDDARTAPAWFPEASGPGRWKFHVFPRGRLCSLRRALLLWLLPVFVVVALISAASAYWSYTTMVRQFMDNQMEQLGASAAWQEGGAMPLSSSAERVHEWGDYVVQVYDANGRLRASSWPPLRAGLLPAPGFEDVRVDGQRWRVYAAPPKADGERVQVFQSGRFRAHLAFERAGAAVVPVLVLLPLALAVLWFFSGAMSRAVEDIGAQAANQDENSIQEIPLDRVPAELKPMVASFNSLLTRLRDAFAAQRRLVQDAAHELRTPITAVALQLENVCRDMPAGACQESLGQLSLGVQRASRTVDQLLKLSRQTAAVPEAPVLVDLQAQVRESVNALIALADQRGIDIGVTGQARAPVHLRCAPSDLRSALDNLIENALRYTPEGGVVDVHLEVSDGRPVIEVIDTGPGIPPELLERVFDRFYRVPGSRAGGSGLGLSIAHAAAQRCGLRIVLRNRSDAQGLVARLELA
ncbi:ATP-binding protein [Ramlibacter rhizophilus]|uniref:histidine kinase n=1 Tax=Ramlibacter rhizophilus TaxID=1781167 RepID=A0A4Z0BHS9_9BURK|nr:ATP-binding protein [Ramlibacter rhizophilus]TFY97458.1 two-component sensor histidine kinase [Ramlibacter rhizophilus]